jgi:hypothetical protein
MSDPDPPTAGPLRTRGIISMVNGGGPQLSALERDARADEGMGHGLGEL